MFRLKPRSKDAAIDAENPTAPSLEVVARPASDSSSMIAKLSGRAFRSSNGNVRRQLELEVMSQRDRAMAAEKALSQAAQDNMQLTQRVRALEAELAAFKLETGLNRTDSTAGWEISPGELTMELKRLRLKLQQRGMELLDKTQRVQELQQQLQALQQASAAAAEQQLPELQHSIGPSKLRTAPMAVTLAASAASPGQLQVKQPRQQPQQPLCQLQPRQQQCAGPLKVQATPAAPVPLPGQLQAQQLQPQPQPQTQQSKPLQQSEPHQQQPGGSGSTKAHKADRDAAAELCKDSVLCASSRNGGVSLNNHVRELRQWFETTTFWTETSKQG